MLELIDKTGAQLDAWVPAMIDSYAEQRTAAGEPEESARTGSKAQIGTLLPNNRPADGQHVMNVVADGEVVGTLWMGRPSNGEDGTWFVFYVEIEDAHRGKGFGRAAMEAAEIWTRAHGGRRIGLNVFGPNVVAKSLYDSLGYVTRATAMAKELDPIA